MKRFVSILISCIFALSILSSCKTNNNVKIIPTSDWYDIGIDGKMVNEYDMPITVAQLDSICLADTLSSNLLNWNKSAFQDYENHSIVFKYVFIKNERTVYIISEYKDSLAITKRTIR